MNPNEECWIIYGFRFNDDLYGYLAYESEGGFASVDFDWRKIFKNKDKIIGFNHTHPGMSNLPSDIDEVTMIGWVKALGKPLICGIKGDTQAMYLYERCSDKKVRWHLVPFKRVGNFIKIRI